MRLLATNFKQKNDWTCGPAVARIVCHYYGVPMTIRRLTRELKTTRAGTANRDLLRILRHNKIPHRVKSFATIRELRRTTEHNLVIVAYWIPRSRVAHYSIVKKVNQSRIFFHDTWYGSRHSYQLPYFQRNWWDTEATRWYLAIPK